MLCVGPALRAMTEAGGSVVARGGSSGARRVSVREAVRMRQLAQDTADAAERDWPRWLILVSTRSGW